MSVVERPSERARERHLPKWRTRPSRRVVTRRLNMQLLHSRASERTCKWNGGGRERRGGQMRTSLSMKYGAKRRELCGGRRRRRRRRCSCRHTLSPTIPRTSEKLERGIHTGYVFWRQLKLKSNLPREIDFGETHPKLLLYG